MCSCDVLAKKVGLGGHRQLPEAIGNQYHASSRGGPRHHGNFPHNVDARGYPPVYYLPGNDTDMLVRTTHYTYCPYKVDCTYYSIPIGGSKSEYAVWTYEKPYEAVASIKEYLAFYLSRIDAIEMIS